MRDATAASDLLKPYDARMMRCCPVSTRANPRKDSRIAACFIVWIVRHSLRQGAPWKPQSDGMSTPTEATHFQVRLILTQVSRKRSRRVSDLPLRAF